MLASITLKIPILVELLGFHELLTISGQFDLVVRILGAHDHSSTAKICHRLLESNTSDDKCFFPEGACFLAPVHVQRKGNFLPFGSRHVGLFQGKQREYLSPSKM